MPPRTQHHVSPIAMEVQEQPGRPESSRVSVWDWALPSQSLLSPCSDLAVTCRQKRKAFLQWLPLAPLQQPTYPIGAALAVNVLQHGFIQAQLQAGLVEHLPLVGVPGDEAIDLHCLALPDPVATSLSL